MIAPTFSSEFLDYLLSQAKEKPEETRLPSLSDLSSSLGVSVARLREQLEVAKSLGWVEVRPRTGIKRLPFTFSEAVWRSLSYAIELDHTHFDTFANLRKHLELAYWREAVEKLTPEDHEHLSALVSQAWEKLHGAPVRVPHEEHRELHLSIYRRLENPFVIGILEGYWAAYEAVGLSLYTEIHYLEEVWRYHQKMVEAIWDGDFEAGYQALYQHTDLLYRIFEQEHV